MSQLLQMSDEDLKKFIFERLSTHVSVISVSVQKYPSEYSAIVWVGQPPTPEVRQYAYDLEAELENLGVPCSIIVKSDREKPIGPINTLHTSKGSFSYQYLKADPVRDEDMVYFFSLHKGTTTYRVRASLSGTLASILRMRNRLKEDSVLEVYLDKIREKISKGELAPNVVEEITFNSNDKALFGVAK